MNLRGWVLMVKQVSLISLLGFFLVSNVFAAEFDTEIAVDLSRPLLKKVSEQGCRPDGSSLTVE